MKSSALPALPATTKDHQVVVNGARRDVYFSADVETDGPIPGPFSMLSFALVYAGRYDGDTFSRAGSNPKTFYRELKPISEHFQIEALQINGLDRDLLKNEGCDPNVAMNEAYRWVRDISGEDYPILVAYPLSFDWSWLYWYFITFAENGSPFDYSRCYDVKTAFAVKAGIPVSEASRSRLPESLVSRIRHTHHAVDDALEQAEIFANIFEWEGSYGGNRRS